MDNIIEKKKLGRKFKINTIGQIIHTYYQSKGIAETCAKLGITRKTFYNTMKRMDISFAKRDIE
jgi:transcriptional regulator of acetoin/glycerol metabolism